MVGVAGRSKGCSICRKRKIGCDQKRPQCTQCVRGGRDCPGYLRDSVFVVHVGRSTGKDENAPSMKGLVKLETPEASRIPQASDKRNERALLATPTAMLAPMQRQQLFQEYLCSYLPAGRFGIGYEAPWFVQFPDVRGSATVLELSLTALCAASLGREKNDDMLVAQGVQNYARGLEELQNSLRDARLMQSDETFAACMALLLIEVIECPANARSGYYSHQRGVAQLVKMRGPKAHTSALGHSVFRTFRLIEALGALESHAPTFLTDPVWLEMPWQDLPKTAYEKILDIVLEIPALFEKTDDMLRSPVSTHAKSTTDLFWKYWQLDTRLQALRNEQELEHAESLFWPELSTMDSPADDTILGKVFPVAFRFSNLGTANVMMLLWTTLTMTRSGWTGHHAYAHELCAKGQPGAAEICRDLPDIDNRETWMASARSACQCVEYCVQEPASGFARLTASVPLQLLVGYFKNDPRCRRELDWTNGVLDLISNRGMRLLRHTREP